MKKLTLLIFILVTLEVSVCVPRAVGKPAAAAATMKPKLVVAIVVDQFRYDYLLRFRQSYTAGLKQLLSKGAVFANARLDHFPTYTAVGHSAFLSGAYPSMSGIVGNSWYDRDREKMIGAAFDDSVQTVGGAPGAGSSPRSLMVSTVGDEMKLASQGQSKVIGISWKDYGIIMATGHMANGVFWFDSKDGNFVSSSYYVPELPPWLKEFNAQRPADQYKGSEWQGTRLPAEAGSNLYRTLPRSPFGNDLIEKMAEAAIKGERMGRGTQTDLLVLSFSANDFVGHSYGPDSPQVRDMAIATDQVLGKLFKFIDTEVSMSNVTVVLTADHGVAPVPEENVKRNMPGGRISAGDFRNAIQKALTEKFGEGNWILSVPENAAYFNWDLIDAKKLSREQVERQAAEAAAKLPHVFRVYTRTQLLTGYAMADQAGRRVMNSFFQKRCGDLYVLTDPYFIAGRSGTTHGSVFGYDTHVPLIFMGPGIKTGRFNASVIINDVAPTLATILDIDIPSGSEGRILSEIFAVP